jgi:hypothetical protein
MIDTTKWRVALTSKQADLILKRSSEISEYNHESKETKFRILKTNVNLGSYLSSISIKCFDDLEAEFEFSIPKQLFGNNVVLLYPAQLEQALYGIWQSLVDHFGDFPPYMTWHLQRLDLCYSWKLPSQAVAQAVLSIVKTFDYPRKSKYIYSESVMWRGKTLSIKFYLKYLEYKKHHPVLGIDQSILELSKGVLRFEITLRKQALVYIFGKKTILYDDLLSQKLLEKVLSGYLDRLTMNLDKNVTNDNETLKRLKETFPLHRKAIRLYTFYKQLTSSQLNDRRIIKENYNPSTVWRNRRDIAQAKVGLPSEMRPLPFKLEIPSELVVNRDEAGSSAS